MTPVRLSKTKAKVAFRLLPFIFVLYIIAYLDRANVSFARDGLSEDLRFDDAVFGLGAGIFFLGYLLLEIPGALLVERWSARKWISRILISWGFCTVMIGGIETRNEFYLWRFLLGVAEAGFFPGIIVYLTHWFPQAERSRALSGLVIAIPASLVIGAPLSSVMLQIEWLDLPGWRWLFILQGLPAVLLGVVTLMCLPDRPRDASWLSPEEREALTAELEAETRSKLAGSGHQPFWKGLTDPNVLLLALALMVVNIAMYSFTFFLPTILKRAGNLSGSEAALLTAVPFACALVSILLAGWSSDRFRERKWHTALPMFASAIVFALSALPGIAFPAAMVFLCLTAAFAYAWPSSFWVLPTLTLGPVAAAASIGLINSIGNLGGFIGPYVVGQLSARHAQVIETAAWTRLPWFSAESSSTASGVFFLSLCFVFAALVILRVQIKERHAIHRTHD